MKNIKQFKLTNNEEIVCEVLEWDTQDEIADILISKTLRIVTVEAYARGYKFFAFRPWLSFTEDPESLQTLNSSHVVVASNPSPDLLKHYKACIYSIRADLKNSNKKRKAYINTDEIAHAVEELTEEEMDQFLAEKYGHMVREDDLSPDSDLGTNIIPFKPKGTLH